VVKTVFRAPLPFAFRWCTDYSTKDGALEEATFARRVLRRDARRVVYEDLDPTDGGWMWSRWTVTLQPPDRWHGVSIGNYRSWTAEYRLRRLDEARTAFQFRGRRRVTGVATKSPPRAQVQKNLNQIWKRFGRALEADYRATRRKPAGRRRRR
jgi:hypothetical protein